jgi:hypothetical protein
MPRSTARSASVVALERAALRAELEAIGFTINVDDPGCCAIVMVASDGRRKLITAQSMWDAARDARSWWRYQQSLKPDAPQRFNPASPEEAAYPVIHAPAGDTAHQLAKAEATRRRVLSFDVAGSLVGAEESR